MKSAYIITNSEMISILKEHLAKQGFKTANLSVRFTSTNAVVAGIEKVTEAATDLSYATGLPGRFDDEDLEEEIEEENTSFALSEAILDEIATAPMTAAALATALDVEVYEIVDALGYLEDQVAAVAPARESGATVSKFMKTGTETYDLFVAAEKNRVAKQVEKWKDRVCWQVPKFHERREERPAIVDAICANLASDDELKEEIRRDAKAVFYKMADLGILEHESHGWRMAKTEADRINVQSLQGAVREILMEENGQSIEAIRDKLPGTVEMSLLGHAVRRMDGAYEQGGLLYLNS